MKKLFVLFAIVLGLSSQALAQGHDQVVADSAEPRKVFDHHDANKNGVLEPDEFEKAYDFSPSRDCVTSGGLNTQDPRCDGHSNHRGHSGDHGQ